MKKLFGKKATWAYGMMFFLIALGVVTISTSLTSCLDNKPAGDKSSQKIPGVVSTVEQLAGAASEISDALSKDSLTDIKKFSIALVEISEKFSADGQKNSESGQTFEDIQTVMIHADILAKKDYDLETTRKIFAPLSDAVARMVLSDAETDKKFHVFYCAMVGHYWIQKEERIRNPFYGGAMLDCGEKATSSADMNSDVDELTVATDESDPFSTIDAPPSEMALSVMKKMMCGCCKKDLLTAPCGCAAGRRTQVSALVDQMESKNMDEKTILSRLRNMYGEDVVPVEQTLEEHK